jgi:hypothetical protein
MHRTVVARLVPVIALTLLAAACGDDQPTNPASHAVTEFVLMDVNPNSATGGQSVSPRDYLQKATAWYFGHAT